MKNHHIFSLLRYCQFNWSDEKDNQYLDTCASHHISPNRNWFVQYTRTIEPEKVYLENNTHCSMIGKGSITFQLPNRQTLCINEVFRVLDFQTKLNYVEKVTDLKYNITFKSNECVIRYLSLNQVICTGWRQINLYKLDAKVACTQWL